MRFMLIFCNTTLPPAPGPDILEALKMSLAEGKKPPASVREATTGTEVPVVEADAGKSKKGRKSSAGD